MKYFKVKNLKQVLDAIDTLVEKENLKLEDLSITGWDNGYVYINKGSYNHIAEIDCTEGE